MTRDEAEKLIGKTVHCWSALNGCYIGELLEVLPSRPWRGRVKILAVTEYPVQGLSDFRPGFRARKPAGYGEIRDFGGINIKEYCGEVPDYKASLVQVLQTGIERLERNVAYLAETGRRDALLEKWLTVLRERLEEAKKM